MRLRLSSFWLWSLINPFVCYPSTLDSKVEIVWPFGGQAFKQTVNQCDVGGKMVIVKELYIKPKTQEYLFLMKRLDGGTCNINNGGIVRFSGEPDVGEAITRNGTFMIDIRTRRWMRAVMANDFIDHLKGILRFIRLKDEPLVNGLREIYMASYLKAQARGDVKQAARNLEKIKNIDQPAQEYELLRKENNAFVRYKFKSDSEGFITNAVAVCQSNIVLLVLNQRLQDEDFRERLCETLKGIQRENEFNVPGNGGILGLVIELRDHRVVVAEVLGNSAAEEMGIQPGEEILKVDNNVLTDLPLSTIVRMLRLVDDVGLTIKDKQGRIRVVKLHKKSGAIFKQINVPAVKSP
ncbi:MAG: PDZ domain-containing protein [Verrucomicrobiae bacterium]|nr:PDZ domain-containing protein [Verrucomicrobiae bacterium]